MMTDDAMGLVRRARDDIERISAAINNLPMDSIDMLDTVFRWDARAKLLGDLADALEAAHEQARADEEAMREALLGIDKGWLSHTKGVLGTRLAARAPVCPDGRDYASCPDCQYERHTPTRPLKPRSLGGDDD